MKLLPIVCALLGSLAAANQALAANCGRTTDRGEARLPQHQQNRPLKPPIMGSPELLNLNTGGGTFAASLALDNGGWIDGVYECDVALGGTTERMLVSMNGKADGRTIYAVASMKTRYGAGNATPIDQPFRGYGIGAISGVGYTGTTWNGQPFSFSLLGLEESTSQKKYDVLRIKGSIGIDANRTAQLVCKTDRALF